MRDVLHTDCCSFGAMSQCDSKFPSEQRYQDEASSSEEDDEDYYIAEEEPRAGEEEPCITPDDVPASLRRGTGLENYFNRLALEGDHNNPPPSNKNTTFADLSKFRESQGNAINLIYSGETETKPKKHATFATLPNSTTWQQLSALNSTTSAHPPADEGPLATQLLNIRLKLEEKRRKIEQDKRRMEALCKHQRQKLSKAAFLQAISKVNSSGGATPDSDSSKDEESSSHSGDVPMPEASKDLQLQEITEHLNSVSSKWLHSPEEEEEEGDSTDTMNSDEFQTSIELLNTSLTDIQEDIARISLQERMIKTMMNPPAFHSPQPPPSQPYYTPPSWKPVTANFNSFMMEPDGGANRTWNSSFNSSKSFLSYDSTDAQTYPVFSQNTSTYTSPPSINTNCDNHHLPSRTPPPNPDKFPLAKLKPALATIPSVGTPEESPEVGFTLENGDASDKPLKSNGQQKFYVAFDSKPPKKAKPKLTVKVGRGTKEEKAAPVESRAENKYEENKQPSEPKTPKPPVEPQVEAEPCVGFMIGADLVTPDPQAQTEMEKKKEQIMLMSLKRKAEQEQKRLAKEAELSKKREQERARKEEQERKKEEKRLRHQAILEQYLERKAQKEGEAAEGEIHSPARTTPRPKSAGGPKLPRPKSAQNTEHPPLNSDLDYELSSLPSRTDCISETSSTAAEYTGPKLFVKPTAKSNRTLILNAVSAVLAGAVNADTKKRVIEAVHNSSSKHFLILFRDAGCQFRALYTYNPDSEEVVKMYGTGPRSITSSMMDKFYKYNSGGKCFSQIHTKHLTVTIDAFTIHNALWTGRATAASSKRAHLPLL